MSRYIDKYNCLLEDNHTEEQGMGDALWRTSLAAIAYPDKEWPREGIVNCLKSKFKRHPEWEIDDCSRDQMIMAIVATYLLSGERNLYGFPYHISKKFTWFGSYSWYLGMCGERVAEEWFKFISFLTIWTQPAYARHLLAWQLYTLPNDALVLNWIGRLLADRNNFLVRLLHGGKVTENDIHWYQPMNDFRWQRSLCKPPKGVVLFGTPDEQYPIDKDVLKAIYEREFKKVR